MSYLVLARRERPQTFEDVAGQRHVVRTLQNSLRSGRLHHAYLFTGTRGVGKTSTARILAKALNCENGPTPEPCGVCASCVEIREGRAIDVIEIDAASHRGIDDAKELLSSVSYLPSRSRFKVYVIDEVHMLSREAFNALLKTLEEPPPHVKFIFATTEPHKIPPTIGSRCQWFDFKALSPAEIQQRLQEILSREKVEASDAALRILTREAAGSMRDAQSLLDQVLAYADGKPIGERDVREVLGLVGEERVRAIARSIVEKDADRALRELAEAATYGSDMRLLVRSLAEVFRSLAIWKSVKEPSRLLDLSEEELVETAALAGAIDREEALRILGICLRCDADMGRTPFPQLVVEIAILKSLTVVETTPLAEILSRLDELGPILRSRPDAPAASSRASSGPGGRGMAGPTGERGGASGGGGSTAPPAGRAAAPLRESTETGPRPPSAKPGPARAGDRPAPAPSLRPGAAPPLPEANLREAGDLLTRFVAALRSSAPMLAAQLGSAAVLDVDDVRLRIGVPGALQFDILNERDNKARMETVLVQLAGKPLRLEFSRTAAATAAGMGAVAGGGGGGGGAASTAAGRDRQWALRKEAIEDPLVFEALRLFEGDIVDVRPPKGDAEPARDEAPGAEPAGLAPGSSPQTPPEEPDTIEGFGDDAEPDED